MAEYGNAANADQRQLSDVVAPRQAVMDNSKAVATQAITTGLAGATQMVNAADSVYARDKRAAAKKDEDELEHFLESYDDRFDAALKDINEKRATGQLSPTAARTRMLKAQKDLIAESGEVWGSARATKVATAAAGSPLGRFLDRETQAEEQRQADENNVIELGLANRGDSPEAFDKAISLSQELRAEQTLLNARKVDIENSDLDISEKNKQLKALADKQGAVFLSEAEQTALPKLQRVVANLEKNNFSPEGFRQAKQELAILKHKLKTTMGKLTPEGGLTKGNEARYNSLVDLVTFYETQANSGQLSSDLTYAENFKKNKQWNELTGEYPELSDLALISSNFGHSPIIGANITQALSPVLDGVQQKRLAGTEMRESLEKALTGLANSESHAEALPHLTNYVVQGGELNPLTGEEFVPLEKRLQVVQGAVDSIVGNYGDDTIAERQRLISWLGSPEMSKFVSENVGMMDEATVDLLDDQMKQDLNGNIVPKVRGVLEDNFRTDDEWWSIAPNIEKVEFAYNGKDVVLVSPDYSAAELKKVNERISPTVTAYVKARAALFSTPPKEIVKNLTTILHPESFETEEKTNDLILKYDEAMERLSKIKDPAAIHAFKRSTLAPLGDAIRNRPNMEDWEYVEFDQAKVDSMSDEEKRARLEELRKKKGGE